MSAFASYNKNNAKGTLVGNWVEEEALRAVTGYSRRHVPGMKDELQSEKLMAVSKRFVESTHDRVMLHSNDNGVTTYETTAQASTKSGGGVIQVPTGPRQSVREGQIFDAAREIHESDKARRLEAEMRELQASRSISTTKASFHASEVSQLVLTTRVPRGRNGARVIDTAVAHLSRGEVDSLDKAKLALLMQQEQCNSGIAVTRYSYALVTGMGIDFGTTASDSTNPFGRSSSFTNDIHDPTKRHAEATEPGSSFDEQMGMTIHQRSALERLVTAFRNNALLWKDLKRELGSSIDSSTTGNVLELDNFRRAVATHSILGDRDAIHVFMYFDKRHVGAIKLEEFVAFFEEQLQAAT